jgi:hypothetical protein
VSNEKRAIVKFFKKRNDGVYRPVVMGLKQSLKIEK